MSSRTSRATGLAVELAVVVLGVLIALAADSWWEDRKDEERAATYLTAIAEDMADARQALRPVQEATVYRRDLTNRYVAWLSSDLAYPDSMVEPPRAPLQEASLPVGTLDALVTTGDISLIRDPALRATLIREQGLLQDRRARLAMGSQTWLTTVQSWLYSLQEFRLRGVPLEGQAFAEAVRGNATMSGHYGALALVLQAKARDQQAMLDSMERIADAIDSALD